MGTENSPRSAGTALSLGVSDPKTVVTCPSLPTCSDPQSLCHTFLIRTWTYFEHFETLVCSLGVVASLK